MENLVRKLITVLAINAFIISIIHISYADVYACYGTTRITKKYVNKVTDLIHNNDEIRLYYYPNNTSCQRVTIKSKRINFAYVINNERFYRIVVNNSFDLDLECTYINQKGHWKNLAILVGIRPKEAPEYLPEKLSIEEESADKYDDSLSQQRRKVYRCLLGSDNDSTSDTQKEREHPIDLFERGCLNDVSTPGMINCTNECRERWEVELKRVYRKLKNMLNLLDPECKKALEREQSEWKKYRDAKNEFISSFYYSNLLGSGWIVLGVDAEKSIVRERSLELKWRLEVAKDEYLLRNQLESSRLEILRDEK